MQNGWLLGVAFQLESQNLYRFDIELIYIRNDSSQVVILQLLILFYFVLIAQ